MTTSNRPFAVVTGASSGIGLELAKQFQENGYDLLIAAQSDRIHATADTLQQSGATVRAVQADLASYEGVEALYRAVQEFGRPLDAAAINAGVGVGGDFAHTDLNAELNLINLNVVGPVHFTKCIVPDMIQAGKGRILFTSSIAGVMPAPFEAVYGASKAFIRSFGQAIRNELKDTGVSVTLLMPGVTETEFFDRAGMQDTKAGQSEKDDPAQVAKQGFDALMAGKDHIVAGSFMNKVQATMAHMLPDPAIATAHRQLSEPGSGNK